jgi:hypothetical protein
MGIELEGWYLGVLFSNRSGKTPAMRNGGAEQAEGGEEK